MGQFFANLSASVKIFFSNFNATFGFWINLLLVVALFFCNRMRLSGTLCSVGIPLTPVGGLLALATGALRLIPSALPDAIANAVFVLTRTVAPVHYVVLGLGIAALIGAIVAKALHTK